MPVVSLSIRDPKLLRSLQYFDAVARTGSIKAASEAMGVSPSAVSHQLRALSEMIGEDLLSRSGRGVTLTRAGTALSRKLGEAFTAVDSAISDLVGAGRSTVRLAVCSSFGPSWLAPRLPTFIQQHPAIDLELRLFAQDPEQSQSVADAIVTADPVRAGYTSITLFDEFLVAVQRSPPGRGTDEHFRTLITTDPERDNLGRDWRRYHAALNVDLANLDKASWLRCTHYILALELAKSGLGIALVPDFIASEHIAAGTIEYYDSTPVSSGRTYRLAFKQANSSDPSIRALVRWLKQEAPKSP